MAANQSLDDLIRAYLEGMGVGANGSSGFANPTAPSPSAAGPALTGNGNVAALLAAPVQLGAAGSRRIYSYNIQNPNAAVAFVQLFNKGAGAPVPGTDTPLDWLAVPAGGVLDGYWELSPNFSAGLWVAATTGPNNGVAPGAGLPVSIGFM